VKSFRPISDIVGKKQAEQEVSLGIERIFS